MLSIKYSLKLTCSTLVSIEKDFGKKEVMEKIVLINVPTEIYSTLYDTFVFIVQPSWYKKYTN